MKLKDILQEYYHGNITEEKTIKLINELIKQKIRVAIFKHSTKKVLTK